MKSVGEVMAIGRTFEESLQKAIRQVDPRYTGFEAYVTPEDLDHALAVPTDTRLFAIAHAMYNKGYTVDMIHDLTKIDKVSFALIIFWRKLTFCRGSGSFIKSTTLFKLLEH
jgi:carbamoyl-phosphate synthase large subunit